MVNLEDLEKLAEPSEVSYSQPKTTLLSKYNIPLHYLDFDYIDKCNNAGELEKILHILQSGEEGHYPELVQSAEKKLQLLKPNSKYLRNETPVLNSQYLNEDERNCLKNDLSKFVEVVEKNDEELKSLSGRERHANIPEIRTTACEVPVEKTKPAISSSRIKSTDYDSWDKYDVDTEILKMDLNEQRLHSKIEQQERVIEKYQPKKSVRFKRNLTEAEAIFEANREREKGNEYYKAGEYLGAYNYYTRSIDCKPTVPALTNRALVALKLLRFHDVIEDCQNAIKEEPENVKAHVRLGLGFEGLKQYEKALAQAEIVIRIDPNNTSAQTLANNCYKQLKKREGLKSTRMPIIEVLNENKSPPRSSNKNNKKTILKKHIQQHQRLKKSPPKSSKFAIVPIPGTSSMEPPYFVKVDKTKHNQIVIHNANNNAFQNQVLLHLSNVYNNSEDEDDDDCTVIHIDPQKKLKNTSERYQISNPEQMQSLEAEKYDFSISKQDRFVEESNLKTDNIDTNISINKSTQELFVPDYEKFKSMHINDNASSTNAILAYNVSKAKHKEASFIMHNNEDNLNLNIKSLTINMNPQIEVLAARTTVTATSNDKGGSGEPEARSTEPRDDVHMPYIFANTWNCLREDRSFAQHASVLRTLDLRNLPQIIGCKLDGTILSELLHATYRHLAVVDEVWRVHDLVTALPRIPRFGVVRLFMTDLDRACLNNLIQFLEQHGTTISAELRGELIP